MRLSGFAREAAPSIAGERTEASRWDRPLRRPSRRACRPAIGFVRAPSASFLPSAPSAGDWVRLARFRRCDAPAGLVSELPETVPNLRGIWVRSRRRKAVGRVLSSVLVRSLYLSAELGSFAPGRPLASLAARLDAFTPTPDRAAGDWVRSRAFSRRSGRPACPGAARRAGFGRGRLGSFARLFAARSGPAAVTVGAAPSCTTTCQRDGRASGMDSPIITVRWIPVSPAGRAGDARSRDADGPGRAASPGNPIGAVHVERRGRGDVDG
jgi:hypothetical protein